MNLTYASAPSDSIPSLEDCLARLDTFLTSHTKNLTTLKKHLETNNANVQLSLSGVLASGTNGSEKQNPVAPAVKTMTVDTHLRDLQLFLHTHLENVQTLHKSLDGSTQGPGICRGLIG
jgi:hypothetical protein